MTYTIMLTDGRQLKQMITSAVNNAVTGIKDYINSIILNKTHPVKSIYMSTDPTSPEELFGGTWVQIKDCFLLTAGDIYVAGSTGGEAEHTLTLAEGPSHVHYDGTVLVGLSGTAGSATAQVLFDETAGPLQQQRAAGNRITICRRI